MTTEFIGLDIEATGADWQPPGQRPNYQRFALCQIGLAYLYRNSVDETLYGRKPEPRWVSAVVGHDTFDSEPEAMAVHKITEDQIRGAPRPAEVERSLIGWMDEQGIRKAIPVGYSVGSFDMPYVREAMPEFARRISMRSLDLNAVVFTISEITGRSHNAVKAAGANYAEKVIRKETSMTGVKHDAGYDALSAILSWEYFKSILVMREIHDHL